VSFFPRIYSPCNIFCPDFTPILFLQDPLYFSRDPPWDFFSLIPKLGFLPPVAMGIFQTPFAKWALPPPSTLFFHGIAHISSVILAENNIMAGGMWREIVRKGGYFTKTEIFDFFLNWTIIFRFWWHYKLQKMQQKNNFLPYIHKVKYFWIHSFSDLSDYLSLLLERLVWKSTKCFWIWVCKEPKNLEWKFVPRSRSGV